MDFVRWGMSGAAPRFIDKRSTITRLTRADDFGAIMDGREHHAGWFKLINHPDARLIAAAPDMAAALGKCITALMFEAERHAREQDGVALAQVHDAIMSARAALTKAKEQI
jgi:hypothetical protein